MESLSNSRNSLNYISYMEVVKRNGNRERVSFDKIIRRIEGVCERLHLGRIDPIEIAKETVQGLYNGITTEELDFFAANKCAEKILDDPEYNRLAAGLCISNLHKTTSDDFLHVTQKLYNNKDAEGNHNPLVTKEYLNAVMNNKEKLNATIDYSKDFDFDFFAIKTLEKAYLIRLKNDEDDPAKKKKRNELSGEDKLRLSKGKIIERPQQMIMRVALGIHGQDIDAAIETYNLIANHYFTHASPTLFNAGTPRPQLASCFLLDMDDSIDDIFETISDVSKISKWAGGIGIHLNDIRASKSIIRGTNGTSDGIIPLIKVLNEVGRYINQCFTPDTMVFSKNGPIKMGDVKIKDELYTIDGSLKRVNEVIKNTVDKEIYEINVVNSFETVKVTGEHQIYVIPNQKKITNLSLILNRLKKDIVKPVYKSVKDLTTDDIVCFPKPKYLTNNEFDEDHHRFYGIMLRDGYIYKKKNCNSMEYGIAVNEDSKIETYKFIKKYLESKKIHYWENNQDNCISIKWTYCEKLNIKYDELYDSDDEKIISTNYLNLSKDKTTSLLKGLINNNDDSVRKEIYYHTTSKKLAYQIRFLLMRFGVLVSGHIKDDRDTTQKITYVLRIPKHEFVETFADIKATSKLKYFEYDDKMWSRITSIKKIDYKGEVLDFNMQDNHNYLTNMGLVHNSGRRNGAIAIYIEPWHADIYEFCDLRKNTGAEELRARDIFLALWVNDLFMKRVQENGMWSLMCPDECPGLTDTYGLEFEQLYIKYEQEGKYRKQVKAEDLWFHILTAQIETGMPYMLYKDSVNEKSNQKNIGVIKSSNLCSEIVQYSDQNEIAVCNLCSLCLPKYIITNEEGKLSYDFNKLLEVAQVATRNLNKIIDVNFYPVNKAKKSNFKHRPIGIGVQGLADTYCILDIPFDSEEARHLNKQIFETIYYGCLKASNDLAKQYGPYETFNGSPFSKGQLQYHMWGLNEDDLTTNLDWSSLINDIKKYGTRNSLLTALMPTASTSQIMNNNEAFEPFTTNLYTRTTLAGEYVVINRYLIEKLIKMGLWTKSVKDQFMYDNGSIQKIDEIPNHIKEIYKTAFEMKAKPIVQQAVDRGPFIDQTQSMNIFSNEPDFNMLTSSHFYGWKNGLKTGMYYLRSQPAVDPIKFGMDPETIRKIEKKRKKHQFISESSSDVSNYSDNDEHCESGEDNDNTNVYNGRLDNYKVCEMCSG